MNEAVAVAPRGPLGRLVHEHHGYRQRGTEPARHLGMPSPYLTVIFALDEPLQVARHPDGRQPPGAYWTLVGGLHSTPALIVHDGAQSGIQLQMSPLGARALFGRPAGELADVDVPAGEVIGSMAALLSDRLRAAGDWGERFAVLDRMLGRTIDADSTPPAEVVHAWRLLVTSGGTMQIRDVAREVGWSQRHLAERFDREIGLRPKTAARVIRFDRARRTLQRNVAAGGRDIAGVAAGCGYFDQAHLVRDWRQFTGLTPGAWISHEVQNFQATPTERMRS